MRYVNFEKIPLISPSDSFSHKGKSPANDTRVRVRTLGLLLIYALLGMSSVYATDSAHFTPPNVNAKKLCCVTTPYNTPTYTEPKFWIHHNGYNSDKSFPVANSASYHELLNCPAGYIAMGAILGYWDGEWSTWAMVCLPIASRCQWVDQNVNSLRVQAYYKYCDYDNCRVTSDLYNMPCITSTP